MDCFFPALREKCRDFFLFIHRRVGLFIGTFLLFFKPTQISQITQILPVPADLKSAVKKGSTYENGGFVIPL